MTSSEAFARFATPPLEVHPRPLWFWNGQLTADQSRIQIEAAKAAGYSGFGVVATHDMNPPFMSDAYLEHYHAAVETAAELEMSVCLYDDFWFPTGTAGGRLAKQHPEALSKRLDLHSTHVSGPIRYSKPVPPGTLMAAVAMNIESKTRVDISDSIVEGFLSWHVPEGRWRIMFFVCVTDGAKGLVDYLEPSSVKTFMSLTYDRYRQQFARHFGNTIDMAFHDETTFHWVEGGRAWTPRFNEYYRSKYGEDPTLIYPALWFDIGPETAAARCRLFGFRTELFSDSFIRQINAWCTANGLVLTGHVDQEEVTNPVGLCGDLMKIFEHQDIPAFDQIFYHGRANQIAKVVSSAATNYDAPLVMCECYGVIENITPAGLYREAIDLYARGTNMLVPHAMWYTPAETNYPPDLSPSSPDFGPHLAEFNTWAARIQSVLQLGSQVADVAILYPIDSLKAGYRFGAEGDPYEGGVTNPEADYLALGDMMFTELKRDFTFIHPDVLDTRCTIATDESGNAVLRLETDNNEACYRVVLIPGSTAISASNLRILRRFHDAGGALIGTTRLPDCGTDYQDDAEIRDSVASMFGPDGRGVFLPELSSTELRQVFNDVLPTGDVMFENCASLPHEVSCLHKRITGSDRTKGWEAYFISNSSESPVELSLRLRGVHDLALWDPATGLKRPSVKTPRGEHPTASNGTRSSDGTSSSDDTKPSERTTAPEEGIASEGTTQLSLSLEPLSAVFAVSEVTAS